MNESQLFRQLLALHPTIKCPNPLQTSQPVILMLKHTRERKKSKRLGKA